MGNATIRLGWSQPTHACAVAPRTTPAPACARYDADTARPCPCARPGRTDPSAQRVPLFLSRRRLCGWAVCRTGRDRSCTSCCPGARSSRLPFPRHESHYVRCAIVQSNIAFLGARVACWPARYRDGAQVSMRRRWTAFRATLAWWCEITHEMLISDPPCEIISMLMPARNQPAVHEEDTGNRPGMVSENEDSGRVRQALRSWHLRPRAPQTFSPRCRCRASSAARRGI